MARNLSGELKQYTFNLLMLIGKEVDEQFAKWNKPNVGFLATYVDAHSSASQHQAETLKEYADEERRAMERALLLIEIMSIPAVAWLGAALELRLGPKLFYEYKDGWKGTARKYFFTKVHDEFKSKIFGDAAKDLAGTVFKLTGEKIGSDDQPEVDAHKISFSPDLNVFGTNLYMEVDKQSSAVQTNINKIAQHVNNSFSFGDAIVMRLQKENAGFDRLSDATQFNLGTRLINELLQANRSAWASYWLYYGYDPPQPDWRRITEQLEREIWCIWILQQDLHAKKHGWNLFTEDYQVSGASGTVLDPVGGIMHQYEDSPIETRLYEEFNAPVMDYEFDYALQAHSRDWADKQAKKLREWAERGDFSYLIQELRGKPRILKSIDRMW